MKAPNKRIATTAAAVAAGLLLLSLIPGGAAGKEHDPWNSILAMLKAIEAGIADLKGDIQSLQNTNATPASFRLSSGPFGLPANAASVDWTVLNNSASTQRVTVTVFRFGVGPKTVVPPGALSLDVGPGEASHNANSVGPGLPFPPGFNYEVVLESTNANVLPMAVVWQDFGNTQIPGTLIPSGCWVKLR